jgi:hypothetical protein
MFPSFQVQDYWPNHRRIVQGLDFILKIYLPWNRVHALSTNREYDFSNSIKCTSGNRYYQAKIQGAETE